ncbi:MAG: fumarate hydratase [Clostridiales bacterium]|nr:MAG: fumarate hydratase [Clostridiales bacterium]
MARDTNSPVCQDTGLAVVFLEIGQDVALSGKYVAVAVNDGVRQAYENFRKSSVHPLSRKNSGDNTPAIIHTRVVKGDKVKVSCMMKGFGSENMSRLFMLTPADGVEGVVEKVVETVKDAGSCPCPPVILGVGVGGTMEKGGDYEQARPFERPGQRKTPTNIFLPLKRKCLKKSTLWASARKASAATLPPFACLSKRKTPTLRDCPSRSPYNAIARATAKE